MEDRPDRQIDREAAAAEEIARFHRFQNELAVAMLGEVPDCFEATPEVLLLMVRSMREERDRARQELRDLRTHPGSLS